MRHGFISYAHADRAACDAFRKHLRPVERALDFRFWIDDQNRTGQHFGPPIQAAIARACAHLLFVSTNSLWSDYVMDEELPAVVAKQHAGDLVMIVVVNECDWEQVAGTMLASPRDERHQLVPINLWKPQSRGMNVARRQISDAIQGHFNVVPRRAANWSVW